MSAAPHAQIGVAADKVAEQTITVVAASAEAAAAATPAVPLDGQDRHAAAAAVSVTSPPPSVSPNPYPFGSPLRPVRGTAATPATTPATSATPDRAPKAAAAPFSPAMLADAASRDHAPPVPVAEHRVAAPDADFEIAQSAAEKYFHKRQLSAMEARKKAAEAAAKRRNALVQAEAEASAAAQRDADAAWEAIRLEAAAAQYEAQRIQAMQGNVGDGVDEPAGVPVTMGGAHLAGGGGMVGSAYGSGMGGGDYDGSAGSATMVAPSVHAGAHSSAGGVGSVAAGSSPPLLSQVIDPADGDGQPFWSYPPQWAAETLGSNIATGITEAEAASRLKHWGSNKVEMPTLSFWSVVLDEIKEPLILLLLIIAVLYALWGKPAEAATAGTIILLTVALELWTEYRAKRAVASLASASFHPPVLAWRAGVGALRLPPEELVPGDLVDVGPGERVRADGRLVASTWLLVDEAALTGESRGVAKDAAAVHAPATAVTARSNMVWSGTLVLHGTARLVVTATGRHTRVGHVASLASSARRAQRVRAGRSPLQVRMKELAMRLTVVAALCCMLAMSLGFMRGLPYRTVLLMGLSLAFATIPEELPLLIKAVLAVGALNLSRAGVLVKSLRTAEALGGLTLLLTDKTGTLTRNRLSVLRLAMPGKLLRVPRSVDGDDAAAGGGGGGGDMSPSVPFQASTEDMLAFEPCIEQGWMMSSPTLVAHLSQSAHGGPLSPSVPSPQPQTPLTAAAMASEILAHAVPNTPTSESGASGFGVGAAAAAGSALILDPFDASLLRFFAASRSHPRDLNSVFLRKLFTDSFRVAAQSQLLHVLPYDAVRRRSSCIRRLSVSSADVGPLRLCCRGGAEFVLDVCVFALHSSGRIISLDAAARAELRETLRALSAAGLRVMAFAVRSLIQDDLDALEHRAAAAAQAQAGSVGASPAPMQRRISEGDEKQFAASSSSSSYQQEPNGSPSPHAPRPQPAHARGHSRTASTTSASSTHAPLYTSLERKMTLLGLIAFGDEVRAGVAESVRRLQLAGVKVKMVTGDMQRTGAAVARAVGILTTPPTQPPSQAPSQAPTPRGINGLGQSFGAPSVPIAAAAAAEAHERNLSDTASVSSVASGRSGRSPAPKSRSRRDRDSASAASMAAMAHAVAAATEAPIPGVCVGRSQHASPAASRATSRATSRERERRHGPSASVSLPSAVLPPPHGHHAPSHSTSSSSLLGGQADTSAMATAPGSSPSQPMSKSSSSTSLSSLRVPAAVAAQYDLSASVYCRMTPQDKLHLVQLHQSAGHSVLVTGDGLNDGAALACADAGMAMGGAGTDLARECAGLILVRDDFRAVVEAVAEGRRVLRNLANAVRFYLAAKAALVLLFLTPLALGRDLPLSPLHVIALECLLDLGASAAFTTEPPPPDLMRRSPAQWGRERFMRGKKYTGSILAGAALLFLAVAGVLFCAHHMVLAPVDGDGGNGLHAISLQAAFDSSLPLLSPVPVSASAYASLPSTIFSERERVAAEEERVEEAAGRSSSAAPSHSSSNFFPSVLPRFRHDPHLALTQSLVFAAWLLASVMLATLMRSDSRSFLFACCDRQSIRAWRKSKRARGGEGEGADDAAGVAHSARKDSLLDGGAAPNSPRLSLSAALRSSRHSGYASLSQSDLLEEGGGPGAHAAFQLPATPRGQRGGGVSGGIIMSGGGDGDLSDADSDSSQGSSAGRAATQIGEIEGLHRPRDQRARAHARSPARRGVAAWFRRGGGSGSGGASGSSSSHSGGSGDPSLFATIFPLLSNAVMLLWALASASFAVAAVSSPWLRAALHLAPIDVRVTMPALLGEAGPAFPAFVVAIVVPAAVFFLAELVKYVASFYVRPNKATVPV